MARKREPEKAPLGITEMVRQIDRHGMVIGKYNINTTVREAHSEIVSRDMVIEELRRDVKHLLEHISGEVPMSDHYMACLVSRSKQAE